LTDTTHTVARSKSTVIHTEKTTLSVDALQTLATDVLEEEEEVEVEVTEEDLVNPDLLASNHRILNCMLCITY
jgi:hypothetical protein